jgi:serine/threonine-protein kinase
MAAGGNPLRKSSILGVMSRWDPGGSDTGETETFTGRDVLSAGTSSLSSDPSSVLLPLERDLMSGDVVEGYHIEGVAGRGAFGTVYRASHKEIGAVAIKVLSRACSQEPEVAGRFVAEARAAIQIRHPNVIDIFSYGQLPDGRYFYVMEFLEGIGLDEHLKKKGRLPIEEALPILRGVASGLEAAHKIGVAHRDLKPANVFLVQKPDGALVPKLLDFGLAKLLPGGAMKPLVYTQSGAAIGTPFYMSPEQCEGRQIDHRADIYAFGVMSFELMTGRLPFPNGSSVEVMKQHLSARAPRPSSIEPELSSKIDSAIAWMLSKDPERRPSGLGEAMKALEEGDSARAQTEILRPMKALRIGRGSLRWPASADKDKDSEARFRETGEVLPKLKSHRGLWLAGSALFLIAGLIVFWPHTPKPAPSGPLEGEQTEEAAAPEATPTQAGKASSTPSPVIKHRSRHLRHDLRRKKSRGNDL